MGIALVGAVLPEQIPELIQAQRFEVIDDNGTMRAEMHHRGFRYWDKDGMLYVQMGSVGIWAGLRYNPELDVTVPTSTMDENGFQVLNEWGYALFEANAEGITYTSNPDMRGCC